MNKYKLEAEAKHIEKRLVLHPFPFGDRPILVSIVKVRMRYLLEPSSQQLEKSKSQPIT